jgi:CheY-like chemotaxis protein
LYAEVLTNERRLRRIYSESTTEKSGADTETDPAPAAGQYPGRSRAVSTRSRGESDMKEARTAAGDAPVSLAKTNVLLVAADAAQPDALRSTLEGLGARVTVARSQKAALDIIDYTVPDVVIQFLRSASEDGAAVLRRMRTLDRRIGCTTPAIAVTEAGGGPGLDRLVAAGYQALLARPLDDVRLARAVIRVTGQEAGASGLTRYMSTKRTMLRTLRSKGREADGLRATA